jgi:hypothetical protein
MPGGSAIGQGPGPITSSDLVGYQPLQVGGVTFGGGTVSTSSATPYAATPYVPPAWTGTELIVVGLVLALVLLAIWWSGRSK